MRSALGASRNRIARLLLAESLVLAFTGGAGGLLLATLLMPVFIHFASRVVPGIVDADLSSSRFSLPDRVCIRNLVRGSRAGRAPVAHRASADIEDRGERSTGHRSHRRLQRVMSSSALCLALAVGAMLFIRTFVSLTNTELGFNPAHVISIDARFPMYRTMRQNRWQLWRGRYELGVATTSVDSGVEAASAIDRAPLSGTLVPVRVTLDGERAGRRAFYRNVTSGYSGGAQHPDHCRPGLH